MTERYNFLGVGVLHHKEPDKAQLSQSDPNGLGFLWSQAREELERGKATRTLTSTDLPEFVNSEHERRGEMGLARVWRIDFFRRSVPGLLACLLERGVAATTASFWREDFPRWWFSCAVQGDLPPPLLASLRRPPEKPYGSTLEYCEFANGPFIERVKERLPCLLPYIPEAPYDPNDATAADAHSRLLSAVSVILTSQRLNLVSRVADRVDEILTASWMDISLSDPFRFRFRSRFWPDTRYNYVGLRLRPILAQALCYREEIPWDARYIEQDLPLTEAAARTSGGHIEHSGLRRNDIELAVWCEVLARMVEDTSAGEPVRMAAQSKGRAEMNIFGELPYRLRNLVQELDERREAKGDRGGSSSRFLAGEFQPRHRDAECEELRTGLGDVIRLLPNASMAPVLEESTLCINLDWNTWTGEAEWMELDVVALVPDSSTSGRQYVLLDYIENELIQDADDTLCLTLMGPVWESLRSAIAAEYLERAFAQSLIAQQDTSDGNGCAFVVLIDLAG